jgi:uncharacterized membrane protein
MQRRDAAADGVVMSLGWFSIGLGLAELLMPRQVARLIGIAPTKSAVNTIQAFGAREVGTGLAVLMSPHQAGPMWGRVAGDAIDLTFLGMATRLPGASPGRLTAAALAVSGVAVADAWAAAHLSRNNGTRRSHGRDDVDVRDSITIGRPLADVYGFWRNFTNFPRFMPQIASIDILGDRLSRWTVSGPAGIPVSWEAEIVTDDQAHMLSWRSVPGSQIENRGAVRFEAAPAGRGTELHVELRYRPPAGQLGRTVAWIFGKEPGQQIREDLRRVKQLLETGDIVLSDGPGIATPARPPLSREAAATLAGVTQ